MFRNGMQKGMLFVTYIDLASPNATIFLSQIYTSIPKVQSMKLEQIRRNGHGQRKKSQIKSQNPTYHKQNNSTTTLQIYSAQ
jgi:hypothetical protein